MVVPGDEQGRTKVFALAVIWLAAGCVPPLPATTPKVRALQFAGPEGGWPPVLKNASRAEKVPTSAVPGGLDDDGVTRLAKTAVADAGAQQRLGARFAFISATPLDIA